MTKIFIRAAALAAACLLLLSGCKHVGLQESVSSEPTTSSLPFDTQRAGETTTATETLPTDTTAASSSPSNTSSHDTTDTTTSPTTSTLPAEPPVNAALTPVSPENYYGLQQLKAAQNPALVEAYRRIVSGVENLEETVSVEDLKIPPDDMLQVYICYLSDYPQHFWMEDYISYAYPEYAAYVEFEYGFTKAELPAAKKAVQDAASRLLEGLTDSMSAYDRELAIHDRLVEWATYDQTISKPKIYNIYGALVNRLTVCQGYAETFQYLLYQAGIPCLLIRGEGKGESHAWNMVEIDGVYAYVDVTWDDFLFDDMDPKPISYANFNITTEQLLRKHTIDELNYKLPDCRSDSLNYYVRSGMALDSYSIEGVAALLKKGVQAGQKTTGIWIAGDPDGLFEKVQRDIHSICRQAGVTASVQFIVSDREILFQFT